MNVVVTGGSGYFGELLCKKLLELGFNVSILDLVKNQDTDPRIQIYQGDIRDKQLVIKACEEADIVFHSVAQVPLAKNKKLFESVNHLGTRNALEASVETQVKNFIYISSSAIFGIPQTNPVTEDITPKPMEAYGEAKYRGELLCKDFSNKHNLNVSIIRPRTILGHGRLGIFQILFEWIRQGKNVPVLNGGENIYQFIHADDLAECCILASQKKGINLYNCGAKKFGTMKELLQDLCDYAQTGSKVKSLPMAPIVKMMDLASFLGLSPLGKYHSLMYGQSMYFDTLKTENELHWRPKYSNKEMIIESYDWYLKNRELVLKNKDGSAHKSMVKQGILRFVGDLL